jgi:hypothetical protein
VKKKKPKNRDVCLGLRQILGVHSIRAINKTLSEAGCKTSRSG